MDDREVRMRAIEAAVRTPMPHPDGYAAGVLEAAALYAAWILSEKQAQTPDTLHLPKKGK